MASHRCLGYLNTSGLQGFEEFPYTRKGSARRRGMAHRQRRTPAQQRASPLRGARHVADGRARPRADAPLARQSHAPPRHRRYAHHRTRPSRGDDKRGDDGADRPMRIDRACRADGRSRGQARAHRPLHAGRRKLAEGLRPRRGAGAARDVEGGGRGPVGRGAGCACQLRGHGRGAQRAPRDPRRSGVEDQRAFTRPDTDERSAAARAVRWNCLARPRALFRSRSAGPPGSART